jgi:hypothetical protein
MKKLITSFINAGAAQPIKQGTLDHLQQAHEETMKANLDMLNLRDGQIRSTSSVGMRMGGLRRNGTFPNYTVLSGAFFFENEVWLCDGGVFLSIPVGQVLVCTKTITYVTATNADPVEFSDASSNNVHAIRKIVISAGLSGSGDFDFDDAYDYNDWFAIPYSAGYLSASTPAWTIASSADWDVKYNENGKTVTIDFAVVNGTLTNITSNVQLILPFNNSFKGTFYSVGEYANGNNTTPKAAMRITANDGGRTIRLQPIGDATFAVITGGLDVRGQITVMMRDF